MSNKLDCVKLPPLLCMETAAISAPGRHSGDRQAAAEIKVRAVCFVREAQHTGIVRHLYDCAQVAANAVVCGVIDEHRHGVRVFADGFCHLLALHTERNTEAMIHLRVDVDRAPRRRAPKHSKRCGGRCGAE